MQQLNTIYTSNAWFNLKYGCIFVEMTLLLVDCPVNSTYLLGMRMKLKN